MTFDTFSGLYQPMRPARLMAASMGRHTKFTRSWNKFAPGTSFLLAGFAMQKDCLKVKQSEADVYMLSFSDIPRTAYTLQTHYPRTQRYFTSYRGAFAKQRRRTRTTIEPFRLCVERRRITDPNIFYPLVRARAALRLPRTETNIPFLHHTEMQHPLES